MIRMNNFTKITQRHYKIKTRGKGGGGGGGGGGGERITLSTHGRKKIKYDILCHEIHVYCIT